MLSMSCLQALIRVDARNPIDQAWQQFRAPEIMDYEQTPTEKRLIAEIEAEAGKAGISMRQALAAAGIAAATWDRWKRGAASPTMRLYLRLRETVRELGEAIR